MFDKENSNILLIKIINIIIIIMDKSGCIVLQNCLKYIFVIFKYLIIILFLYFYPFYLYFFYI